jgi:hypothetical protein
VLNGLYLLYTSQNLLGTIFGVTFTVFYRRIWNIVGKYSILCCNSCAATIVFTAFSAARAEIATNVLQYKGLSKTLIIPVLLREGLATPLYYSCLKE